MTTAEILMILFMVFSSLGIGFTSASVGESLQDAFSNGHIDFSNADTGARDTFKEMLDVNQGLSDFVIPAEAVGNDGNVSASDLANAGVDPADWMQANQDNINQNVITDNGFLSFNVDDNFVLKFLPECRGGNQSDMWDYYVAAYDSSGTTLLGKIQLSAGAFSSDQYPIPIFDFRNIYVKDGYLYYTFSKIDHDWRGDFLVDDSMCISLGQLGVVSDNVSADVIDPIGDAAEAAVGAAVIGGQIYDLNPDGSVTVNGTDYPMNPDGSVTINNVNYYPQISLPAYNDEALQGLLRQILSKLNQLEYDLTFDDVVADDLNIDVTYDGLMSEFLLDSAITQVFPFCLPFDFARAVRLFSVKPKTPVFKYDIKIPAIGSYSGDTVTIVLDFSPFEGLAYICRWVSTIAFALTLVFITPKIVKGAGA